MDRRSSSSSGHFSCYPVNSFRAVSQPYTIFRNKDRYCIYEPLTGRKPNFLVAGSQKIVALKEKARREVFFFEDQLSEHYIPSDLLYDHLLEDSIASDHVDRNRGFSTITGCRHKGQSLIVYTSGERMNNLMLRPIIKCKPYSKGKQVGYAIGTNSNLNINTAARTQC